jgi:hypothetical protein
MISTKLRWLVTLFLVLAPCAAHAYTVTQQGAAIGNGTTATVGPFDPGAGSVVYVLASEQDSSGSVHLGNATDSLSNLYSTGSIIGSGTNYVLGARYFYYASDPGNITVTYHQSTAGSTAIITVISFLGSNGTYDAAAGDFNSGTSTSPTVTAFQAPQVTGELFIGVIGWDSAAITFSGATFPTPPNAFNSTPLNIIGGNFTETGLSLPTYSGTFNNSIPWLAIIDAFEPSAAPPATLCTIALTGAGPC